MATSYKDLGLVNTKELFAKAIKGGYAIPAYNFNNMEQMQAILQACVETQSPVILQVSKGAREYANQTLLRYMAQGAVQYAKEISPDGKGIPIVLHLDHGPDFETCKSCIDNGFSSVMIDGSHLPYEENIKETRRVVEYAHQFGVTVEGELGVLAGVEDDVKAESHTYTQPEEVEDFVKRTGVDSLAIAIGTSHGAFKFKPGENPKIRLDILAEIEKRIPGFPIVLHGSSSVPQDLVKIINEMAEYLNVAQMKKLQEVLLQTFSESEAQKEQISNEEYLKLFLEAKKIEGCSERTIQYYRVTVERLLQTVDTPLRKMTTEEIRRYLVEYQKINNCGKVTIDNVRRNISSFFSWLEEEDYILKSPMRRIHKIKTKQPVKETISDEAIERLRDNCKCARDLAMIDLLYSTGIRVGELVNLNISEIDFEARECVVFGKGDKERRVYFDAKAKLHLQDYLRSRTDANPALFVTLDAPFDRLKISGVEIRLRELGRELNLDKIHPHKFRRTMATRAIDKGMPIEQVQKILGHSQIGTTMQYAIVNQNNVKTSHQKFIA